MGKTVGLEDVQSLQGPGIVRTPRTSSTPVRARRSNLRSLGPRAPSTLSARPRRRTRRSRRTKSWAPWVRSAIETGALLVAALIAVIAALGHMADWFGGAGVWSHLVPFAGAVLALCLVTGGVLRGWIAVRKWLARHAVWLPVALASALAVGATWFVTQPAFHDEVGSLRTLVGGPAEAERAAISHQVYAAYRRADLKQVQRMLERARIFEDTVHEAADAFGIDHEVLMGIGAVESSFNPRNSKDGGRGLFQITAVPQAALALARKSLEADRIDLLNQRHNAFVAAATLRRYLDEVRGDLFLGLLAYNMGPRNGGLRSIMQQYGARDFVTIQPYLQNLPRDYPIRVLSAALAYRLWSARGHLPRYEDGDNARAIQGVGIPGFEAGPVPAKS